jgi:hypothetical protein
MVLGQADRPLLQRHLEVPDTNLAVAVDGFLAAFAPEHERTRICRVGQEVVHRPIAGPGPPDPPLPDRSAWQLLAFVDQLHHDLPRRSDPPPEGEHSLDRVTDLLVRTEHNSIVLITIQADRQRQPQLAARGLVAQPTVEPGTDQVQLGFGHRSFEAEQQPIVEIRRRIQPIGVGDQRACQRAQIQQLMPVRRGAREP